MPRPCPTSIIHDGAPIYRPFYCFHHSSFPVPLRLGWAIYLRGRALFWRKASDQREGSNHNADRS
jgi:hypothetical protein